MRPLTLLTVFFVTAPTVVAAENPGQQPDAKFDAALREFNQRGGLAYWYSKQERYLVVRRRFRDNKDERVSLALLEPHSAVKALLLHGRNFSDDDLKEIAGWTQLQRLQLIYNQVSDVGMGHLKGLRNLKRLTLWETNVTGKGLKHLAGMTKLRELDLQNNKMVVIDLQGLSALERLLIGGPTTELRLSKLPSLRVVYAISEDLATVTLDDIPALRELDLSDTAVSATSLKRLKQSFPECEIFP